MEEKDIKIFATVRLFDVPLHLDNPYTYYIPPYLENLAEVGAVVTVPFGGTNRKQSGVITSVSDTTELDKDKIKPIFEISPMGEVLDEKGREMCSFLSGYTLCTYGEAFKTVVPSAAVSKLDEYYECTDKPIESTRKKLSDKGILMYNYIKSRERVRQTRLKAEFGEETAEIVAALLKLKLLKRDVELKGVSNIKYLTYVKLVNPQIKTKSVTQAEILEILKKSGKITTDKLYDLLGKKASPQLSSLEKKGAIALEKEECRRNPYIKECIVQDVKSTLTEKQSEAYKKINSLYETGEAKACLLHGITGSGKTRVIKAMIDRVIEDGRGVIMLVPEISLTPQTVSFFCGCYGERVAVIHSSLSQGERFDSWKRIREGKADIVIGTRSAVFAPLKNIGMIVIDEEQEHTYKSDQDPKYLAHDVARFRCGKEKALMLLSSATPSVNSYYKAKSGIYSLVELKERYGSAVLPDVIISDMRGETDTGNLSSFGTVLREELVKTYCNHKQSIIFLNRRGYNNAVICRVCGAAVKCPNCSISMTYHVRTPLGEAKDADEYRRIRSERGILTCHYCGTRQKVPDVCPDCNSKHFKYFGCGTQKAQEELQKILPDAKILRMDTDTTTKKNSYAEILTKFREKKADVLLGTQMVTKGHDFPDVTLVGVVNADASLFLDDFKASERTFSMLTQVIGRAGRGKDRGTAVVQTTNPDSQVINFAAEQNYESFYEKEINVRKTLVFPPFCDIALLTVSSMDESLLRASMLRLSQTIKDMLNGEYHDLSAIVYGPFEAPVYKVQGVCRMRMVIKCKLSKRQREMLMVVLKQFGKMGIKNLIISADLNPSSL